MTSKIKTISMSVTHFVEVSGKYSADPNVIYVINSNRSGDKMPNDEFQYIIGGIKVSGAMLEWEIDNAALDKDIVYFPRNDRESESKEKFLDYLKATYPQCFEWLLWHPEIFEGKYIENDE